MRYVRALMIVLVALCGSSKLHSQVGGDRLPVWIDTDPSVAPGGHEVDDAFHPFDTLAVGYVLSPRWFDWEDFPVEVRSLPDDAETQKDGKVAMKPYLLASKSIASNRVVRYCYSVSPEFKKDLMKRLLRR